MDELSRRADREVLVNKREWSELRERRKNDWADWRREHDLPDHEAAERSLYAQQRSAGHELSEPEINRAAVPGIDYERIPEMECQEPNWEPTIHEPERSLPFQEIETYEPIPEIDWDSFTPEPIEHERER